MNKEIIKITKDDDVPENGKFLYADKEFVKWYGPTSSPLPLYRIYFYYEVDKREH